VAPKLAWLRRRVAAEATITTTDTWLLHRLCGAFVTDVATAGRSLLTDLDTGEWSPEACELFGVDPVSLPAVVGNAQPVGESGKLTLGTRECLSVNEVLHASLVVL